MPLISEKPIRLKTSEMEYDSKKKNVTERNRAIKREVIWTKK